MCEPAPGEIECGCIKKSRGQVRKILWMASAAAAAAAGVVMIAAQTAHAECIWTAWGIWCW